MPIITPPESSTTPRGAVSRIAALEELVEDWQATAGPVGVVVRVAFEDGSEWSAVAGLADREAEIPMQTSDKFLIASITKTFMAALTLRLAELGEIDIDAPLDNLLPDFPASSQLTFRRLLGHRAGVHDPTPQLVSDRDGPPDPTRVFQPEELLDAAAPFTPTYTPGSRHEYSNANYWVAGAALEAATGSDIASLMEEHVLTPLGLESTSFFDSSLPEVEIVNSYHDLDRDGTPDPLGKVPLPGFVTPAWTAGAMISTVDDLTSFFSALVGGDFLEDESREAMFDTSGDSYGLGVYERSGAIGHDGGITGFLSAVFYDERTGAVVAVLTNRSGPDSPQADELTFRLISRLRDLVGG